MSLLVFDSSAALKWYLPEIYADKAKQIRDDYCKAIIDLIAPDIFPVETLHAFMMHAVNDPRQKYPCNLRFRRLDCEEVREPKIFWRKHLWSFDSSLGEKRWLQVRGF